MSFSSLNGNCNRQSHCFMRQLNQATVAFCYLLYLLITFLLLLWELLLAYESPCSLKSLQILSLSKTLRDQLPISVGNTVLVSANGLTWYRPASTMVKDEGDCGPTTSQGHQIAVRPTDTAKILWLHKEQNCQK